MPKKLTKKSLAIVLKNLGGDWELNESGTELRFKKFFSSNLQAFMFMTRVVINAEVLAFYPDILLSRLRVIITISSEAGLTRNECDLAERINTLALSTEN